MYTFWFFLLGIRDFPGGSDGKASVYNTGDPGLIPGSGISPGEGNGNPLQYSCLENPMDRGAWQVTVHAVMKSRTRLSDFIFTFQFHALEKEMATHSSVLAWRIPGTGEPSELPSMGSHRVRHNWSDLAAAAGVAYYRHIPVNPNWGRKWQPTPVFLPGESQGQRSLVGYSPWGRKKLDMTGLRSYSQS